MLVVQTAAMMFKCRLVGNSVDTGDEAATMMLRCRLVDTSKGKLVDNSVDAGDEGGDYDAEMQTGGHKWREVGG